MRGRISGIWFTLGNIGLLASVLVITRGSFAAWAVLALFAMLAGLASRIAWVGRFHDARPADLDRWLMAAASAGFFALAVAPVWSRSLAHAHTAPLRGFLMACACWCAALAWTKKPTAAWHFLAVVALAFAARVALIIMLDETHIDVFEYGTRGAQALLHGDDPYALVYEGVRHPKYGYIQTFAYGPFYALCASVGYLVGDIRYASIAAEALCALAIWRSARGTAERGPLMVFWLSFPVSLVVLLGAWVDGILLAAFAWMWVGLRERRVVVAGLFAGLGLGIKQTACIAVALALGWVTRVMGLRAGARFAIAAAVCATASYVPFVAWDWWAIWQSLVGAVLETAPRENALTLHALFKSLGDVNLLGPLQAASIGICAALLTWVVLRRRSLADLVLATAIAYMAAFLFGFQAFINYYYFVAGVLVLEIAQRMTPEATEGPSSVTLAGAQSGAWPTRS